LPLPLQVLGLEHLGRAFEHLGRNERATLRAKREPGRSRGL
jgi:hypothetical protein